ncbi:DUF817 family protein, partial [Priestia megaterium]|uniref:DUF817 family protein n=1 Tax=Priestia megaterium TaxID=1404 RepID=UPI0037097E02
MSTYHLILLPSLPTQLLILIFKPQTLHQLKLIPLFHLIPLTLQLYKLHIASSTYPEKPFTKLSPLPLYSPFIYPTLPTYISQLSTTLQLNLTNSPSTSILTILSMAIYLN